MKELVHVYGKVVHLSKERVQASLSGFTIKSTIEVHLIPNMCIVCNKVYQARAPLARVDRPLVNLSGWLLQISRDYRDTIHNTGCG